MGVQGDTGAALYRVREAERRLAAVPQPGWVEGPFFLGRTTSQDEPYPTAPGSVFMVEVVDFTGEDVEGGPVTVVGTGHKVRAANTGTGVPPVGTVVRVYHPANCRSAAFVYNTGG